MSEWGDEIIRHKYDPLPEDGPRHRKKSKKRHSKSDHKHEYEKVCVDSSTYIIHGDSRHASYHLAVRCKTCGRVQNIRLWQFKDKPPEDMPLYRVDDFYELLGMKELPEGMKVRD